MTVLSHLFLVLHFVGWAIVLGGYVATVRDPGVYRGTLHGALTALVSGIALVGIREVQDLPVDHAKIGVKLVFALLVTVLAVVAKNRGADAPTWTKHAIGAATVVNIVVAVFWR